MGDGYTNESMTSVNIRRHCDRTWIVVDRRLGMRLPTVTHGMCSAAGCVVPCVWSRFMSRTRVVPAVTTANVADGLNRTASNLRLNLDYATLWCHPRSTRPALGRDMMTRVSRRWFEAFYWTAGGLEPHGFGPIGGIHASESCVKGRTSRPCEVRPLTQV